MSSHFGKCPCPENLIQIETGPSIENLIKEMRYTYYHLNNPVGILKQSSKYNSVESRPLGGPITPMANGADIPTAVTGEELPDIHPCRNCTEEKQDDNTIATNIVENLKEEAGNEDSSIVCYIITSLLFIALIVAIICKIRGM